MSNKQTLFDKIDAINFYDLVVKTPVHKLRQSSQLLSCDIYLKREDFQPVHSFKLRGAYNKLLKISYYFGQSYKAHLQLKNLQLL